MENPKPGVPPPRSKQISRQQVPRDSQADLGRDPYAQSGNYSKTPPPRVLDEYDEI